jgi:hypothetical protein
MPQSPQNGTPRKVPELKKIDEHQANKWRLFPIIANMMSHWFRLLTREVARSSPTKQGEIDTSVEMHNITDQVILSLCKNLPLFASLRISTYLKSTAGNWQH